MSLLYILICCSYMSLPQTINPYLMWGSKRTTLVWPYSNFQLLLSIVWSHKGICFIFCRGLPRVDSTTSQCQESCQGMYFLFSSYCAQHGKTHQRSQGLMSLWVHRTRAPLSDHQPPSAHLTTYSQPEDWFGWNSLLDNDTAL